MEKTEKRSKMDNRRTERLKYRENRVKKKGGKETDVDMER